MYFLIIAFEILILPLVYLLLLLLYFQGNRKANYDNNQVFTFFRGKNNNLR